MIGTIYIALTGLQGSERGLRVISDNTANLNTPGFKGSMVQFTALPPSASGQGGVGQSGLGVSALGTLLSFEPGPYQTTNNSLDLAVDGQGMFMLRDDAGNVRYTRDGQFKFDASGNLVTTSSNEQVMGLNAEGALVPMSIANARVQYASPTGAIHFAGSLSTGMQTVTVPNVTIIDRAGGTHTVTVQFTQVAGTSVAWDVGVLVGNDTIDAGQIAFIDGQPDPAHSRVTFDYPVAGQEAIPVELDFSTNTLSYDYQTQSSMAVASQSGYAPGMLTAMSFDAQGALVLTYSNGQSTKGARLALGRFNSVDAVKVTGNNEFEATDASAWVTGLAGQNGFGTIRSGTVEMSNVDLSSEFSALVILQRGYQASSQVVSTANEMLADLFGMKGK